jgi:hypothetical protein
LKDKSQLKAKKQKLLKKETNKQTNPEEFYYRFYICRKKSIVFIFSQRITYIHGKIPIQAYYNLFTARNEI